MKYHASYHKAFQRAVKIFRDPRSVRVLVRKAGGKLQQSGEERTAGLKADVLILMRMIKAYFNGNYRSFSNQTVVMFLLALIYFVMPMDLVPDLFPIMGFTDDVAVLATVLNRFSKDIEHYRNWEKITFCD